MSLVFRLFSEAEKRAAIDGQRKERMLANTPKSSFDREVASEVQ